MCSILVPYKPWLPNKFRKPARFCVAMVGLLLMDGRCLAGDLWGLCSRSSLTGFSALIKQIRSRSGKLIGRPLSPKNLQKVLGTVQKHSPDTFRRLSRDVPDCPRDFLEAFWGKSRRGDREQERKRHININLLSGDCPVGGGVSRSGGQGSKTYLLSSEPKEHKSFCPGTRPGRPVTGVTGQTFMCKSFMCLFCFLKKGPKQKSS